MKEAVNCGIECLLRELAPQALGAVMRQGGDFGAAEDAVQEALIAAAEQWPTHRIPGKPLGWLIQVARRRLSDQVRSEISRRKREEIVGTETQREVSSDGSR
jgi:predicted RNA polymerase sigma factor